MVPPPWTRTPDTELATCCAGLPLLSLTQGAAPTGEVARSEPRESTQAHGGCEQLSPVGEGNAGLGFTEPER